ncbi:MAG TPA: tetratricopeptide repeat protein [Gaiellaceae bacterium]|jgi:tetratricopeptide (TPR) repeat protein|nr:tetratricopeptide repeat protein [Gaiellaceae bacterium]
MTHTPTERGTSTAGPGRVAERRPTPQLGERLRQLRVAAGLTQTDVAGDRFSKEYISQIERGKTRPTAETIEWLAGRLGVDVGFLAYGVSVDERAKAEAVLTRAEALLRDARHDEAAAEFERVLPLVVGTGATELHVRALNGKALALAQAGDVREGIELLQQARALTERSEFSDLDRAEVLYRLGVCRYLLGSMATAVALFDEALALGERSGQPTDELKLNVFTWRSRCYRRQRDHEAAREDVERALELAEMLQDPRTLGNAYFSASLVAERDGQWVQARKYAEKACVQYELLDDRRRVGRLLNNLGGLDFLLGKPEDAVARFKEAFAIALELGHEVDSAAAVASLAQVHLHTGDAAKAEEQARHALEILEGRDDLLEHIGSSRLVLGRALLEQGRLDEAEEMLTAADDAYAQFSSVSHRSAVWVAQGDLARRRGDEAGAAEIYRRAAEALQDSRF